MKTNFSTVPISYKFKGLILYLLFFIIVGIALLREEMKWYVAILILIIIGIVIICDQKVTDIIILKKDKISFKRLGITVVSIPIESMYLNLGEIIKKGGEFYGVIFCNDEKEIASMSANLFFLRKRKKFYCCITEELLESLYQFYNLPIKTESFKETFNLNQREQKQVELVETYNLKLMKNIYN